MFTVYLQPKTNKKLISIKVLLITEFVFCDNPKAHGKLSP